MPRSTELDKRWDELMDLCRKEAEFQEQGTHPKVTKFVSRTIDALARELGFAERQIAERQFRAERDNGHVVRVVTGTKEDEERTEEREQRTNES